MGAQSYPLLFGDQAAVYRKSALEACFGCMTTIAREFKNLPTGDEQREFLDELHDQIAIMHAAIINPVS